jgi:uncharacterized protein YxeA
MKILKANNPKPGTTPIVVALKDLSNLKLRDNYNPETMNGRTKRYNTYLKDSFDKEGMKDPIKITRVDNGRCKPYIKVPKGGNRCHWAKANGYTHIEAYEV